MLLAVPPNIDDSLSSSDVIVREGANVTLTCQATGYPQPTIKWKRDDGSNITLNKTHSGKHKIHLLFTQLNYARAEVNAKQFHLLKTDLSGITVSKVGCIAFRLP